MAVFRTKESNVVCLVSPNEPIILVSLVLVETRIFIYLDIFIQKNGAGHTRKKVAAKVEMEKISDYGGKVAMASESSLNHRTGCRVSAPRPAGVFVLSHSNCPHWVGTIRRTASG